MTNDERMKGIERVAEKLVERNPRSLPHRSLLALTRLLRGRVAEALDVYANIQVALGATTSSALAVHAAVLAANGNADDAKNEVVQIKVDSLLPEEKALIQNF
jgi:glutaminase